MTNYETALQRRTEAVDAYNKGDYATAARCFTWAAEAADKASHERGGSAECNKLALTMRSSASDAIQKRDTK